MPAKMTWKEKCIAMEEEKSKDDNMMIDENLESKDDTTTAVTDVNMVFALPAEFRAPETEVAELVMALKVLYLRSQKSPRST